MITSAISGAISAGRISLNFALYNLYITGLDNVKSGLVYNHFDCSVIQGSESRNTLPVMKAYITLFGRIWKLLRDYETLVDRDVKDLRVKAQNFVDLDIKLANS